MVMPSIPGAPLLLLTCFSALAPASPYLLHPCSRMPSAGWRVPAHNLIDHGSKLVKDSVARHSVLPGDCTALRESVSSLSSVFSPSLTTPVNQLL